MMTRCVLIPTQGGAQEIILGNVSTNFVDAFMTVFWVRGSSLITTLIGFHALHKLSILPQAKRVEYKKVVPGWNWMAPLGVCSLFLPRGTKVRVEWCYEVGGLQKFSYTFFSRLQQTKIQDYSSSLIVTPKSWLRGLKHLFG
jgi:hypothetical protein